MHELQLQGVDPQGRQRTLAASITVGLPRTGGNPQWVVPFGAGLLLVGVWLAQTQGRRTGEHFSRS